MRSATSRGVRPTRKRSTITSRCSARQRVERHAQVGEALARAGRRRRRRRRADLLARHRPARAHVVDRRVVGDAQDPGGERHDARLVALERGQQLGEDVLRDVLGLVLVAHDRADVAVDVVGVAEVEEAQRVGVAVLGARDGGEHEPLGRGRVLERAPAAEPPAPERGLDLVRLAADRPLVLLRWC